MSAPRMFVQGLPENFAFEPSKRENKAGAADGLFSDPTQLWWEKGRTRKSLRLLPFTLEAQLRARIRSSPGLQVSDRSAGQEANLDVRACRKLCEDGLLSEAVEALSVLVQQGCHIPNNLLYQALKRCIAHKDLVLGRRIHALSVESGYQGNAFMANHLIGLYASSGKLEEAMQVFSAVSVPDAYMWASIIMAYARHGEPMQAVALYGQMRESTVWPDNRIFVAVVKACASARDLAVGKDVHAHILASPGKPDMFVQNALVDMYAKCGSVEDARRLFDKLSRKDVVTWNAMIAGYAQQGMGEEALRLYATMHEEGISHPDSVTFVCLLQACAGVGVAALRQGEQLHARILRHGMRSDVAVGASLVTMYAKCGSLGDARRVFDTLHQKNVVTWNALLAGYAQQGMGEKAFSLYRSMQQEGRVVPDAVTFVCLLQACASAGVSALHQGKQLHAQIAERGLEAVVVVGGSLVNMYAKCRSLQDAQRVFDTLPHKNVVTWNALIAGYAQQGMGLQKGVLGLYRSMQQEAITPPDSFTFSCLLQACATEGVAALEEGKQFHVQIVERGLQEDVVVGNSLVNMYAKCGALEDAQNVFDRLSHKNVVTWTALIAGYVQEGMGEEALKLYSSMQEEGITPPDAVTYVCLLQACACVAALPLAKQLHAEMGQRGLDGDVVVGPTLVHTYAKCGSLEDAQQVFDALPERRIEAWGALIAGYAHLGDSAVVFQLVDRMRLDGLQPDGIAFLSVLTVCSHVGMVEAGRKYFVAMRTDYRIAPTIEHYTCMMDLLGRAGHLEEVLGMVRTMPFQPNAAVWLTVLGACRKWSNVEVGRQAFEFAVRLDQKAGAAYVLMSNIYADADMWEEAKEMQARRVKCGAWKQPGQTWWTDVGGVVHAFVVADKRHPERQGIYSLVLQLKKESAACYYC